MQPRFEALDVEPHRIRRRLVHAGDAELPRPAAGRVAGERDDVADREMGFGEELAGNEYVRRRRCGRGSGGHHGEQREEPHRPIIA